MIILTAKTSALHHHLCLKSTESVAVAWGRHHQAVHQPHQTHHHGHQGGARGLHTAGVLQSLVPFGVHSRAFEPGSGEAFGFIYPFVVEQKPFAILG